MLRKYFPQAFGLVLPLSKNTGKNKLYPVLIMVQPTKSSHLVASASKCEMAYTTTL